MCAHNRCTPTAHTPQVADGVCVRLALSVSCFLSVATSRKPPGYTRESERRMHLSVQTSAMVMGVRQYYHAHDFTLPPHVKFPTNMRLRELVLVDTSVLLDSECNLKADPFEHVRCLATRGEHTRRAVLESFDDTDLLLDDLLIPIGDEDTAASDALDDDDNQHADEPQTVYYDSIVDDQQSSGLAADDWSQVIIITDRVEYVEIVDRRKILPFVRCSHLSHFTHATPTYIWCSSRRATKLCTVSAFTLRMLTATCRLAICTTRRMMRDLIMLCFQCSVCSTVFPCSSPNVFDSPK